ncbi:hypothetical protein AB1Y20_009769 [Prymnesium parvum]|uniref:Uncharacterized protein n=1 Tax=Prymnesium parvum TaxID=97485 RepID=A0AB34K653_PRYPA
MSSDEDGGDSHVTGVVPRTASSNALSDSRMSWTARSTACALDDAAWRASRSAWRASRSAWRASRSAWRASRSAWRASRSAWRAYSSANSVLRKIGDYTHECCGGGDSVSKEAMYANVGVFQPEK